MPLTDRLLAPTPNLHQLALQALFCRTSVFPFWVYTYHYHRVIEEVMLELFIYLYAIDVCWLEQLNSPTLYKSKHVSR